MYFTLKPNGQDNTSLYFLVSAFFWVITGCYTIFEVDKQSNRKMKNNYGNNNNLSGEKLRTVQ
jgi:hypothetical protein